MAKMGLWSMPKSLNIPKNEFLVELDNSVPGTLVVDGTQYFLDEEVVDVFRNMAEEIECLRSINEGLQLSISVTGES